MLASYGLHAGLFRAKFHACTPNRLIDWLIDFSADPLLPPLSHLIFPLSIRSWPVANQNLTGFTLGVDTRARNSLRFREKIVVNPAADSFGQQPATVKSVTSQPVIGSEMGSGDETRGIPRIFYLDFSGLLVFLASTGSFPLILSPSWLS